MKILQSLPSLLQYYSNELSGELLANTLEICATLHSSKTLAVSSTAAATLQQLTVSTFDRVSSEDSSLKPHLASSLSSLANRSTELPQDEKVLKNVKVDGQSVEIGQFAFDALQVRILLLSLMIVDIDSFQGPG